MHNKKKEANVSRNERWEMLISEVRPVTVLPTVLFQQKQTIDNSIKDI